ncbi:hypothetical protein ACJEBK_19700 [Peribacillus frigoritolerans]|uniref:hypothetical protein n=1 Tax=Peribacillus frigoritolerans TaxID=450367 RepID=UPI003871E321
MTKTIEKFATARITPEGKTEIKIEGQITLKEAAKKLQQQYDKGTLFADITEEQKDTILNGYIKMRSLKDIFDLKHLAVKYIKHTPWLGEKDFFPSWYKEHRKFERQLQASESEFKDERQAAEIHQKAYDDLDRLVEQSDEEFSALLDEAIENRDVALFYLGYMKMRAEYVEKFYNDFSDSINKVSGLVQHALADKAITHYVTTRNAKKPKLQYLDGMMFHLDNETETLKYEFFFHVPYRKHVWTEIGEVHSAIKITASH